MKKLIYIISLLLLQATAASLLAQDKPEDFGDYYAWGELEPKDNYTWGTNCTPHAFGGIADAGALLDSFE